MNRGDLTNAQWERLQALLPPQNPKRGRPAVEQRRLLNGLFWILRTGAPWRDLPEPYGPWRTAASRFSRGQKAGLFRRILAALQQQADVAGQLDWTVHFVESTMIRAHQHAAGAKKGTRRSKREAAVRAASAPRSTCEPRATASPSPFS
jgi:transposase